MATLSVKIDPQGAREGARVVKREMSDISREAEKVERGTTRLGRSANDNFKEMARGSSMASKAYGMFRASAIAAIVGVTAGLVGLTNLMGRFTSASVEAQKQQAQLAAAIRSTGGVAGQTLTSLNAHAAALQKVTNFGDEVTNSAQGILLTFTRIRGPEFAAATEAVQNVATAMGQDLKSAAIQVGKALNDPLQGMTTLSRSGITFSESQKEVVKQMVATGNIVGAQTLILKELETQFGGSARAARETLGGALSALGNAWGDLFEMSKGATEGLRGSIEGLVTAISNPAFIGFVQAIGTGLFGALQAAAMAATGLANAASFLADNIDAIGVAAATAGTLMAVAFGPAVLAATVSGFMALGSAGVAAISMITAAIAANPLGALAVGITAAVTALYVFRDEVEKAIGVDVIGVVKKAANYMIGSFVAAYKDITFLWNNFGNVIGAAVVGGVNLAIDAVNTLINGAKMSINDLINTINLIPGVDIKGLDTSSSTISRIENGFASNLTGGGRHSALSRHNEAQQAALNADYLGGVSSAFKGSTPDIKAATTALAEVEAAATGAGSAMKEAAKTDPWKGLRGAVDTAKESIDFAKGAAKGFLSDLRQGLANGEGFWKSFGNAAMNVLDKIISKIEDNLVDALFSAKSAGSGLFGSSGGGGGFLGGLLGGIGKIFGFANGTSYAPGGLAMVGERGPELVELPRGARVNTASETRRMMSPANQNGGQGSNDVVTIVLQDDSGRMASIADQQIKTASGTIINLAVERSTDVAKRSIESWSGELARDGGFA